MTPAQWERVKEVFEAALDREPNERSVFLKQSCADDELLRSEVESLLSSYGHESAFMESPAAALAAQTLLTEESAALVGQEISHYQIVREIGRGGMGVVYLAQDSSLSRPVALKLLPRHLTSDPTRLRRFELEARTASALNHPNILTIYEITQLDGLHSIATEFVEGVTLRERINSRELQLPEVLKIAAQIASALLAAHEAGIVHRDIKPENVMLRRDGYVKVLDFGLAKLTEHEAVESAKTSAGVAGMTDTGVMGTVGYMSPEQAEGLPVDTRTDIFSLGVVMYEMVTGHVPFPAKTTGMNITPNAQQEALPLTHYLPDAPAQLQLTVARALCHDREQRYQTMSELLADLENLSSKATAKRFTARRLILMAASFSVLVAVAALVWLALPARPPRVVATAKITNDGRNKWRGLRGPSLMTDGSRIYTVEDDTARAFRLVQAPVSGGDTVPISTPFSQLRITDLDSRSSELLILPAPASGEQESPLWSYSALNGSYYRLGDLMVSDATWAPDGTILFTSGQELWQAKRDGTEKQRLTRFDGIPGEPRESPDGRTVRVTLADPQHNSTAIWEVSRNGLNAHPLLAGWNEPPREVTGSWTPDGRYYIFQSFQDGKWGIWALREPSGFTSKPRGPFRLTNGPIDYVAPTISPDGKKLYAVGIQGRVELLRFDRDGRRFVPFLNGASNDWLDFSKDGNWIAYVSVPDGQLWRSRADGSDRQQLTFPTMVVAEPRWSPDGDQIAFIARMRGKNWKLHLIPAAGGTPSELLSFESVNELDPTWSPDGKKLVFGRPDVGFKDMPESEDSPRAIYTLDLESREMTVVPGSEGLFSPRLSHHGDLAAVSSDLQRLLLYNSAAGNWTELVNGSTGFSVGFPRWSHDDRYIYFDAVDTYGWVWRVEVKSRKVEHIASLQYLRPGGTLGYWSGLAPDDSPLYARDAGDDEVYAFDLDLP